MDFNGVLEFFNGSILTEEYRGDFPEIKRRLDTLQEEADSVSDRRSDACAKCLLLQAIFALLRGDHAKAAEGLTTLGDSSQGFPAQWQARSLAYFTLLMTWSRWPAAFRYRTEFGGFAGHLYGLQTGYFRNSSSVERTLTKLSTFGNPVDVYERNICRFLSMLAMHTQSAGHTSHPFFPQAFRPRPEIDQSQWYSFLAKQRVWAATCGYPTLSRYLGRIELEFKIARCDADIEEAFSSLQKEYTEAKDFAGLASIYVLNGDGILSPPFSSPLSLNLIATDGSLGTIRSSQWDAVEAGMTLNDSSDAQMCYNKALELYEKSKAPRGRGAVKLRQACVQHAAALKAEPHSSVRSRLLEEARSKLEEAGNLFEMDVSHQLLVMAHKVMLSISSDATHDVLREAHKIGEIALRSHNIVTAQYAGILIMKYGQRAWNDHADSHVALLCFECAYTCFSAIQDQYLEFTALTTRLELTTTLSHHSKSRALADQTILSFRKLLTFMNDLNEDGSDRMVSLVISNIVTSIGPLVSRAYYYSNDSAALIRWFEEITALEVQLSITITQQMDDPAIAAFTEQHGSKDGSFLSVNTQRQIDNKYFHEYYLAEIKAQDALQKFDIVTAEAVLLDLLREIESQPLKPHDELGAAQSIAIYTCHRLGLSDRARILLDAIPLANLLQGIVSKSTPIHYNWSRNTHATFLWDFAIAENRLGACIMAHDWEKGKKILDNAQSLSEGFLQPDGVDREGDIWHRFLYAGLIAEKNGLVHDAMVFLLQSKRILESRRQRTEGEDARRAAFFTMDAGEVFHSLARLALRFHEESNDAPETTKSPGAYALSGTSWIEQALIFVEAGKARALLDSLLQSRSSPTYTGTQNILLLYKKRLYSDLLAIPPESRTAREVAEMRALESELEINKSSPSDEESPDILCEAALTTEIYMQEVYRKIPTGSVVVEFAFSYHGLILFSIDSHGIQTAKRCDFNFTEVRRKVFNYLTEVTIRSKDPSQVQARSQELSNLSKKLSDEIIKPVAHHIHENSHVIFVPSQPVLAFPFSALLYQGQHLFLSKAVSQAPSLSAFAKLAAKDSTNWPPKISALAKPGSFRSDVQETPLKMAGVEAFVIATLFNQRPYNVKDMSSEEFTHLLEKSDIVHVGTHGNVDARSPWQAWISLRERFRVVDVTQIQSSASLVIFSACLSGLGKATIGNDVTGFSHLILSSGASAYVGALWRVDDISTMLLMVLFYREMRECCGKLSTAELWRRAQCALYRKSLQEIKDMMSGIHDGLEQTKIEGLDSDRFVKKGRLHLRNARDHLDMDPRDPFTWAPFIIIGNGDLRFDSASY